MALIDDISPSYAGEDRLVLALDSDSLEPAAGAAVNITVDYSACDPEGTQLPLQLVVSGPVPGLYKRRLIRRTRPTRVSFFPVAGGEYLVLLGEVFHNRWHGTLVVQVAGDQLRAG